MPSIDSELPLPIAAPPRATLLSSADVWMEGDAVAQLDAVAALPGCVRAAGMPDLHPGRGYPIGAVVATRGVIYPQLVGGDAGCGARLVVTDLARVSPDRLERRVRAAFDESPLDDVDSAAVFRAVWQRGARGLAAVDGVPDALRALALRDAEVDDLPPSGAPDATYLGFTSVLGTIGGGNHFAEISKVSHVEDETTAARLGATKNAIVVLVHSGSRGLGTALAAKWGQRALAGADASAYTSELAGACRFARANRLVLAYRLLAALGTLREKGLMGTFDVTHNDVRAERVAGGSAWVHRKGAAPAYDDALTVVLGSRGAPSWVMRGLGSELGLRSVAHGAGRRMGRSEALGKMKERYRRAELWRARSGGRIVCDDNDLLYEEHPDAYKAIEPVIAALETHALARRAFALTPLLTVKI